MADSFAAYDVVRLALDGTDLSTTISDSLAHTFTCNGTAKLKTTTPIYGTASLLIDGTSNCCVTSANTTDWNMGSGDFCVDFWYKPVGNLTGGTLFAIGDGTLNAIKLEQNTGGRLILSVSIGSTVYTATSSAGAIFLGGGQADYIAITRYGNIFSIWTNGTLVATMTVVGALDWNTSMIMTIGSSFTAQASVNAYFDQFRVTKGAARYIVPHTLPIDGNFNSYDTANITTTSTGTRTRNVSIGRAQNPDAIIAAVDAAIIALGWTVYDSYITGAITTKVYTCLNLDATSYKYTILIWDKARWKVTQTSCESWNLQYKTITNEPFNNYRAEGVHGFSMHNCEFNIFGCARYLGMFTAIQGSVSMWSMTVETEREVAEDTAAVGIPCWGMIHGQSVLGTQDTYQKWHSIRYPRTRAGSTGYIGLNQYSFFGQTTTQGLGWQFTSTGSLPNLFHGWDANKRLVSSLKTSQNVGNVFYSHGRWIGPKMAGTMLGNPMDKVTVPVDANYFYDANGTDTEHWILPSSCSSYAVVSRGDYYLMGPAAGTVTGVAPTDQTWTLPGNVANSVCYTGQYLYAGTNAGGVWKIDTVTGTTAVVAGTSGAICEVVFDGRYVYAAMSTGIYRIDTQNADTLTTMTIGTGGTRALCVASKQFLFASDRTGATAMKLYKIDLYSWTSVLTITMPPRVTASICYNLATDGTIVAYCNGNNGTAADFAMGYVNINSGGAGFGPNLTNFGVFLGDAFGITWGGISWIYGWGLSSTTVGTFYAGLAAPGINNVNLGTFVSTNARNYSNVNGRTCQDRIGGIQFGSFPNNTNGVAIASSLWCNQKEYYDTTLSVSPPGEIYRNTGMMGTRFFIHTGNSFITCGSDSGVHLTTGLHGTHYYYDRTFPTILIPK